MTPDARGVIDQIRRAHASARPKPSNPAWFHTHNDLTIVLESHDALLEALRESTHRVRYLLQFTGNLSAFDPIEEELARWDAALARCGKATNTNTGSDK